MSLMAWTPQMSVGVAALDDDHKKLIALINEMHDGMLAGKSSKVVGGILDKLLDYTAQHFDHEERLLAHTNYPGAQAHKQEHEKLTKQVASQVKKFETGTYVAQGLEILEFLRDWLQHHIQDSDKRYASHLNAHGVR